MDDLRNISLLALMCQSPVTVVNAKHNLPPIGLVEACNCLRVFCVTLGLIAEKKLLCTQSLTSALHGAWSAPRVQRVVELILGAALFELRQLANALAG